MSAFYERIKYKLFLFKNLTADPGQSGYVVSDLFAIRNDSNWQTYFELLNINSIITADYSPNAEFEHIAEFHFFDAQGNHLGLRNIGGQGLARQTINLSSYLNSELANAAVFSVFHKTPNDSVDMGKSLVAERGYLGFEYKSNGARSYVHGNLDAIAYNGKTAKLVGNYGYRSRYYYVQHPMSDGAKYEFLFVNTSNKKQKLTFQVSNGNNKWQKISKIELRPGGSHLLTFTAQIDSKQFLRIKSHLYLARPVVFRTNKNSFDVFHG